jgi:FMN phosphatase YigB (HAD superfamily)
VHVGDSVQEDVAGALAAGVEPVLLAREAGPLLGAHADEAPPGVRVVRSLLEL